MDPTRCTHTSSKLVQSEQELKGGASGSGLTLNLVLMAELIALGTSCQARSRSSSPHESATFSVDDELLSAL